MDEISQLTQPVKAIYISTFTPRKCGLATFTKDLTNAINLINPLSLAQIAAMDNPISEKLTYPHEVKLRVRQDQRADYRQLVDYINGSDVDVVVVQHEYGIFGGEESKLMVEMVKKLTKPVVTTLHTVVENPNRQKKHILGKLGEISAFVVVMLETSREVLVNQYGVPRHKVMVIPHGVPDFPKFGNGKWKKKLGLGGKIVMSSINLISPGKGIELAIAALPEVVSKIPNFVYLIVGETHPEVKLREGEKYRQKLQKLVKELKLGEHVRFINRYVSLDKLIEYVAASDIYVTPYLDPQASASGSLAYAIGAGKACISTPYLYAREMLDSGRGVLVPFNDSTTITQAVLGFLTDSKKMGECQENAYQLGRTMTWVNVGHKYFHLLQNARNSD